MTGSEILDFFETLVDDSLDSTAAYILMNVAKNKIEGERPWAMLQNIDSSQSASSAAKSLPADYRTTLAMYVNSQRYIQIPFSQKQLYANSSLRWYLDMKNSQFYLLGSNLSGTINHHYIYQTDDIASGTEPVWPDRYHPLLAYEMAKTFFAVDQGEKGLAWDDRWGLEYTLLRQSMVDWDTQLQKEANENYLPPDQDIETDIGLL